MQSKTQKIIKKIQILPTAEKEKVYDFILLERAKNLNSEVKKLIRFGIKSARKLQDWSKVSKQTLSRSRKFLNGLKAKV